MVNQTSPNFVSLFSGCGGLDLGFHTAGFRGMLSIDIDDAALTTHQLNMNSPVSRMDLTSENPDLGDLGNIDVLLAGSPCQGFSTVGKRQLDDPRNSLLLVAPRIAEKYRPKIVIAENVLGAISGAHKKYWDALHYTLRALGYQTNEMLLDSSDFGVAQKRRRVIMVAWRTGALSCLSFPQQGKRVLGDVLADLQGVPNHNPVVLEKYSVDYMIATRIGPGQKLTNSRSGERAIHTWDIPEVFGTTTSSERELLNHILKLRRQRRRRDFGDADPVCTKYLTKTYGGVALKGLVDRKFLRVIEGFHDLTNTFNGKYRRLDLHSQSRTVDTRFGDPRLFLHPIEHRAFSVREAARIQGFPDSFKFCGNVSQQFRMIGNAVPPPMGHGIAKIVKSLL